MSVPFFGRRMSALWKAVEFIVILLYIKIIIIRNAEGALRSPEGCRPLWQGVNEGDSVPLTK